MPESNSSENSLSQDIVRILLTRSLRSAGYRNICKEEESDYVVSSTAISINLLLAILVGLIIFCFSGLGWSFWQSTSLVMGSLVGAAILMAYLKVPSMLVYLTFMILWFMSGIYQYIQEGVLGILATHALPFAIVIGIQISIKSLKIASGVPFFIPLALIVVILPLLTEDPWRLASAASDKIALLAGVSVIPLVAYFIVQLAKTDIRSLMGQAAERLSSRSEPEVAALARIKKVHNDQDGAWDEHPVAERIRPTYRNLSESDYLDRVAGSASRAFRIRTLERFIALTAGIFLVMGSLIYLLAVTAVPASLAGEWSKRDVPHWTLEFAGLDLINLPLGPFLQVAALMATVACVAFLGLSLIEDPYAESLWLGIVERPAEGFLLLAIPYLTIASEESERRSYR